MDVRDSISGALRHPPIFGDIREIFKHKRIRQWHSRVSHTIMHEERYRHFCKEIYLLLLCAFGFFKCEFKRQFNMMK